MDFSAFVVLEDTLDELATRKTLTEDNARLNECVIVIRACMRLIAVDPANSDYAQKIRQALVELSQIAGHDGERIIAARLQAIACRWPAGVQLEEQMARRVRGHS
jgi:hypothetical protein